MNNELVFVAYQEFGSTYFLKEASSISDKKQREDELVKSKKFLAKECINKSGCKLETILKNNQKYKEYFEPLPKANTPQPENIPGTTKQPVQKASRVQPDSALLSSDFVNAGTGVTHEIEKYINTRKGEGQPLPDSIRLSLEPRFGFDFSQVRVHTDARAAESAQSVNALAYTVGQDVVFGAGQYAPETVEGKKLVAHELTHVLQQSRDGLQAPLSPLDSCERAAEHLTAFSGRCNGMFIRVTGGSVPCLARQTTAPMTVPDVFIHNTELGGLSVGNFDFHFRNCAILIWVWAKFQFTKDINPTEQAAFKKKFVNAVHNVWAHTGYSLSGGNGCPCGTIPIEVHVEENTKSFYHKLVDVERETDETRRPKVISDININFESSDETIAHEFGHVLGLYDEYDGGFLENIMFWHKNQNDPKALMSGGSQLRPRYFEQYRNQVQSTAPNGCQYTISSPKPPVP